jgi:hypothetical protein
MASAMTHAGGKHVVIPFGGDRGRGRVPPESRSSSACWAAANLALAVSLESPEMSFWAEGCDTPGVRDEGSDVTSMSGTGREWWRLGAILGAVVALGLSRAS